MKHLVLFSMDQFHQKLGYEGPNDLWRPKMFFLINHEDFKAREIFRMIQHGRIELQN